ncbi:hypothetical protein Pmar_PMAR007085 [Perkinsus marinus ATCC 50983]|uniref:Uncharacterized protein n=1 Tax=Perkinsus marinus (strain ATCC 50983 / TXsc) TaxID=423536 RepID=C5KZQ8_PERM5|nr:hypothetical protein Pmar_PMAR007085 [Perkinsus marinus ATCC 50983]EER10086.1 hypothetical protein Pmar_PMAR007085 [Perkinsus marinus ATCC 50983]|eukprot:XP_002778291.1 hypothetical protein Pmar_PMAR007085 [Perkinsus marinus ATCC 50983]
MNTNEEASETPVIRHTKKPLLRIPLWFYFLSTCVVSLVIATAINVGVAYAMYPPDIAAETGVWAWPSTICGDLVITAAASFLITWLLAPTIGLNDFIKGFPIETKPSSFPVVTRKLSGSLFMINPVFGKDPENPISGCTAFGRQFRGGIIGAIILAGTWGIVLSLFMMIKTQPWSQSDLALLKGVYGAVTEAICVIFAMVILVIQVSPQMNLLAARTNSNDHADPARLATEP